MWRKCGACRNSGTVVVLEYANISNWSGTESIKGYSVMFVLITSLYYSFIIITILGDYPIIVYNCVPKMGIASSKFNNIERNFYTELTGTNENNL